MLFLGYLRKVETGGAHSDERSGVGVKSFCGIICRRKSKHPGYEYKHIDEVVVFLGFVLQAVAQLNFKLRLALSV